MSSPSVDQSSNVSLIRELLAAEKEDTRRWLRAEMDRLMEPMLDSIFNGLETKLIFRLGRRQSGNGIDCAQMANPSFAHQSGNVPRAACHIPQPAPSTSFGSSLNTPLSYLNFSHANMNYNYGYSQQNGFDPHSTGQLHLTSAVPLQLAPTTSGQLILPIGHSNAQGGRILIEQRPTRQSCPTYQVPLQLVTPTTGELTLPNEHANVHSHSMAIEQLPTRQFCPTSQVPPIPASTTNGLITLPIEHSNDQFPPMPIKQEFVETATEPMEEGRIPQSFLAPIKNEESSDCSADEEEDEEEEECDCRDCENEFVKKEEDDSYVVQGIDDGQELSPLAKKPKIAPTQPNNTQPEDIGEPSRQPADELSIEAQQNQVDKQLIVIKLQCPQSGCLHTFPDQDQLNQHMQVEHDIGPYRCYVKDCSYSIKNMKAPHIGIRDHIKQVHQNIIQWDCKDCDKPFKTYFSLQNHILSRHQLGLYKCSIPDCTFTGDFRAQIYDHHTQNHKEPLKCNFPDCQYKTLKLENLKRHKRIHLGNKPFSCKGPRCDYSATQKSHVITHYRRRHLAHDPSSVQNGAALDPNDFVEVAREIL